MALNISSGIDYTSLFSFGNTSKSSSSSGGTDLINYNSIRNGSYYKLLKSYYASEEAASKEETEKKDTKLGLTQMNSSAADVKADIYELQRTGEKDVFAKKTTTNDDGTETTDYDTDKILGAVKSFVSDYNSVVENADKIENKSILRSTIHMINLTSKNSNILGQVGITIGSDHQLKIDEEAFKNSNMTTVKSIFQTSGSYGTQVSSAASTIMNYSVSALANVSNSSYSASGAYTSSDFVGSLYNSIS